MPHELQYIYIYILYKSLKSELIFNTSYKTYTNLNGGHALYGQKKSKDISWQLVENVSSHIVEGILQHPTVVQNYHKDFKHSNSGFLWKELEGFQLNQDKQEGQTNKWMHCVRLFLFLKISCFWRIRQKHKYKIRKMMLPLPTGSQPSFIEKQMSCQVVLSQIFLYLK